MALNFRLFNCDRTFNLDKVEALIQKVATKMSRETKIEKTYFPLPRMKELSEELEKEGSHFEYAVFVVHAHESRLSINERNAGIGYAKVYRALQKVTGDRVLIVIGGDDNYEDQEERDKSVLSRWAWRKICSQFTEDYVNGVKGFIFSWEEDHHPIHEEALEFYLPKKFVPRPKPPSTKDAEKEETKKIEQAKLLELMKQESQATKLLEQELLRERIEGRAQRIEQAKLLELKKQESQAAKLLEQEILRERNESRAKKIEQAELQDLKKEESQAAKLLKREFPPERNEIRAKKIEQAELQELKKEESQAAKLLEREFPPERNESGVLRIEQAELQELKKEDSQAAKLLEREFPPERNESGVLRIEQTKQLDVKKKESQEQVLEQELLREKIEGRAQRIEQAKQLGEKILKQEFPPERNENRPSPETRTKGMTDHPLQKESQMESQAGQYQAKQASATSGTPDVHILSFHASQPSVDGVVKVFERVYKELGIASKPKSSPNLPINIQDHIMKYKPEYLVLVSEYDNIEDVLNFDKQAQRYKNIVKMSSSAGTKLIFITTEDKKYREGYMSSDAVNNVFTKLNQGIPKLEKPMVLSWNEIPWPTHKEALVQLLTPYGNVKRAAPQQYGATKQDPTSRVPYTQPADVPIKKRFYRASISYGHVVEVLECDPPNWLPDSRSLNDLLSKNQSVKKAIIEFSDEGDGRLQGTVHPKKAANFYKIAEGFATDKMHSILVYSYHAEEETNKEVSNFMHHMGVHLLLPCQPIEPFLLMTDIKCINPDYVMFFADVDALKDKDKIKTVIREYGGKLKDIIEECVGQGVIIMLFGDKSYIKGAVASKETTQDVRMLTQGIVPTDRLAVMTCHDRPFDIHQEWMKQILNSKGAIAPKLYKRHYYKAEIKGGEVTEVLECIPPDWIPDEGIVRKTLKENSDKERKAYLEIHGNEQGEILKITVEKGWRGPSYYARKLILPNPFTSF